MRPSQELDDVRSRTVLITGGLLLAGSVFCVLAAWKFAIYRHAEEGGQPYTGAARLEVAPSAGPIELGLYPRRSDDNRLIVRDPSLDRYGWVDEERGVVHIPIERAADLYLSREPSGKKP